MYSFQKCISNISKGNFACPIPLPTLPPSHPFIFPFFPAAYSTLNLSFPSVLSYFNIFIISLSKQKFLEMLSISLPFTPQLSEIHFYFWIKCLHHIIQNSFSDIQNSMMIEFSLSSCLFVLSGYGKFNLSFHMTSRQSNTQ